MQLYILAILGLLIAASPYATAFALADLFPFSLQNRGTGPPNSNTSSQTNSGSSVSYTSTSLTMSSSAMNTGSLGGESQVSQSTTTETMTPTSINTSVSGTPGGESMVSQSTTTDGTATMTAALTGGAPQNSAQLAFVIGAAGVVLAV